MTCAYALGVGVKLGDLVRVHGRAWGEERAAGCGDGRSWVVGDGRIGGLGVGVWMWCKCVNMEGLEI